VKAATRASALFVLLLFGIARGEEPFSASVSLRRSEEGEGIVSVFFSIAEGHYLYADRVSVTAAGDIELVPRTVPVPKQKYDQFEDDTVGVYDHDTLFTYTLRGQPGADAAVSVAYQGCSADMCFLPVTTTHPLSSGSPEPGARVPAGPAGQAPGDWRSAARTFTIAARGSGYLGAQDFLGLLDRAEAGVVEDQDRLLARLKEQGLVLTVLFVILGGLALNLTPCVLPMIPINLAIIGAGAQASSRRRGFALGGSYGAGIAAAYGVLGLVVVLTGSRFGSLNASPVFNAGITVLFALLALAMFGAFNIDLSRFMSGGGRGGDRKANYLAAAGAGAIAALLAGACVAPVVVSVLLFSANLYRAGSNAGIFFPFLLGAGMALPWPFAGASLSFLPRPGKWMEYVKYTFGVLILVMAGYYGREAYTLFRDRMPSSREDVVAAQEECCEEEGWYTSLSHGLEKAASEGKPVFIDFWASWCKSCLAMDKTTFQDEEVQRRLDRYVRVKYRAEKPNEQATREVLDHFGIVGLPTYLVLVPEMTSQDVSSRACPQRYAQRCGRAKSRDLHREKIRPGICESVCLIYVPGSLVMP